MREQRAQESWTSDYFICTRRVDLVRVEEFIHGGRNMQLNVEVQNNCAVFEDSGANKEATELSCWPSW